MPLDLLDTPLRVTWDLHDRGVPAEAAVARTVAGRLVEAGVFFVTLEQQPLLHPRCAELLAQLRQGGCAVQVHCAATPAELEAAAGGFGSVTLLLDAAAFADGRTQLDVTGLGAALERLRQARCEPALVLTPNRTNLHLLPALFDFAHATGIGRIKLPNTRVDASFGAGERERPLTAADLDRHRSLLAAVAAQQAGLALEVHDLFLWEIFFPAGGAEGRGEYGGCQAGNSLAHVAASGLVYPCSSWPEPIGSLREQTLDVLWQAPLRRQLRQAVESVPPGCAGCRDYPLCFGGCRGLSRTFLPDGDGRDLLCAGRRPLDT